MNGNMNGNMNHGINNMNGYQPQAPEQSYGGYGGGNSGPAPAAMITTYGNQDSNQGYGGQQPQQFADYAEQKPSYGGDAPVQVTSSYKPDGNAGQQYSNAGFNLDYGTGKPYHGDFANKPYATKFSGNNGYSTEGDSAGYDVSYPFQFSQGSDSSLGDINLGSATSAGLDQADLSSLYGASPINFGSDFYAALNGDSSEGLFGSNSGSGGSGLRYKAAASKLIPAIVKAPFRTIYKALTKNRFIG
jgi:hypothetical protein